jgi:hypothetical protein
MNFLDLQRISDERLAWGRRFYSKGGFLHEIDDQAISGMLEPAHSGRSISRDFVPWRFSDACPHSAWMDLSCRRPRNLHNIGHPRPWAKASLAGG